MFTFATREEIQAYAVARGFTNALSNDPATGKPYTATEVTQADLRANDYINLRFYNLFHPDYKAATFDELLPEVQDALREATSRAAIHELETPQFYSVQVNPAEDREIIEDDGTKWRPTTHGSTTERVIDQQSQDAAILYLLDRFLLNPQHPGNRTPEVPVVEGRRPFNALTGVYGYANRCR